MRKFALALALLLLATTAPAGAATKKPTPTPTAKVSVKPSSKASSKPSSAASPKAPPKATSKSTPTASATAKPSSSTSAKPTAKPKPKPKPRKNVRLSPSPKPSWPPIDFAYEAGIYARVPTSKELVGVISAKGNLASQVEACTKFVCGAVQVASEVGCVWWEVNSKVYDKEKVVIGSLQTVSGSSKAREIKTILLISPEPLESLEYISGIEVVCHQEAKPADYPSVTFTKVDR
jgi:hypothetical protein